MSVYSTIQGLVFLNQAAASAFKATNSWEWCDLKDDDGQCFSVIDKGDTMILVFSPRSYRNLGRYLYVDLSTAQRAGSVEGLVTDDCTDGCNSRQVTRFDGTSSIVGFSDCLNLPVHASSSHVVEIPMGGASKDSFSVFSNKPAGGTDYAQAPESVVLYGAPTADFCGCGGYSEDGTAICATLLV